MKGKLKKYPIVFQCNRRHNLQISFNVCLLLSHSLESYSHHPQHLVSHKSLRDSKSFQSSRTYLSMLAVLNTTVVWIVSILPLIFNSANLFSKLLRVVPSMSRIIGITFTLMFHRFFNFLFSWLVGWVLWHQLLLVIHAKSIFMQNSQFYLNNWVQLKHAVSMSKQFYFKLFSLA